MFNIILSRVATVHFTRCICPILSQSKKSITSVWC